MLTAFPAIEILHMHKRHIWPRCANVRHRQFDQRVLVEGREEMLMAALDHRAPLDVHAINRDKVSIVGERLRKPNGILRIPALDELRKRTYTTSAAGF